MNISQIRWCSFPRDVLPEVLLAAKHPDQVRRLDIEPFDVSGPNIAVGFIDRRTNSEYSPPCVLVVDEESAAETLSWLRVYAPESFPLTQFARLLTLSDWKKFSSPNLFKRPVREDIWASVVLGEILGQGETDAELSSIPLSRAAASFSMSIARATCIHGSDDATRACVERLRRVESDRRFVRRAISISDLTPIWAMAGADFGEPVGAEQTVRLVLDAAEKFSPSGRELFSLSGGHQDLAAFSSDSIEERVLAFQKLSAQLLNSEEKGRTNSNSSVLLAAAAFMVGRSTTHEFLLRRVSKHFPAACAWYGLIAALAGPGAWDPQWSRAAKGVERQIRSGFDWADSYGFDLGWVEYNWMAGAFEGTSALAQLPKLLPRVISIEVTPGSVCQFRFVGTQPSDADLRQQTETTREKELQGVLSQFVALANRVRPLLEGASAPADAQRSFIEEEPRYSKPRARRTKGQAKA